MNIVLWVPVTMVTLLLEVTLRDWFTWWILNVVSSTSMLIGAYTMGNNSIATPLLVAVSIITSIWSIASLSFATPCCENFLNWIEEAFCWTHDTVLIVVLFPRHSCYSKHCSFISLTTTINLPSESLGLWCPFFPRSKLIFIHMNLSTFCKVNFCLQ